MKKLFFCAFLSFYSCLALAGENSQPTVGANDTVIITSLDSLKKWLEPYIQSFYTKPFNINNPWNLNYILQSFDQRWHHFILRQYFSHWFRCPDNQKMSMLKILAANFRFNINKYTLILEFLLSLHSKEEKIEFMRRYRCLVLYYERFLRSAQNVDKQASQIATEVVAEYHSSIRPIFELFYSLLSDKSVKNITLKNMNDVRYKHLDWLIFQAHNHLKKQMCISWLALVGEPFFGVLYHSVLLAPIVQSVLDFVTVSPFYNAAIANNLYGFMRKSLGNYYTTTLKPFMNAFLTSRATHLLLLPDHIGRTIIHELIDQGDKATVHILCKYLNRARAALVSPQFNQLKLLSGIINDDIEYVQSVPLDVFENLNLFKYTDALALADEYNAQRVLAYLHCC